MEVQMARESSQYSISFPIAGVAESLGNLGVSQTSAVTAMAVDLEEGDNVSARAVEISNIKAKKKVPERDCSSIVWALIVFFLFLFAITVFNRKTATENSDSDHNFTTIYPN
eukprot:snap_masked-scaffold_14-processed-gene-7.26-mRNA-1 protein AED:1.00 eAED:1.00 QI:0/-1/0/0/-1/1/1/0/111